MAGRKGSLIAAESQKFPRRRQGQQKSRAFVELRAENFKMRGIKGMKNKKLEVVGVGSDRHMFD